ncbi:MAG: ATP synthase subunit I [Lachnospiraceae bacterium]|nr:ATP synthase subunit I [Lachnospiraceae bacterium]
MMDVQPAVKKETKRVAVFTFSGVVLMWVVFAIFHITSPESVPFDYTVFLGGIFGGIVAVVNFFLMGITVQKVASQSDEGTARQQMKASYSQRLMLQILWIIAAIAAPCFQFVAGIAPLLFPSIGIKLLAAAKKQN